eukprot:UN07318
MFRLPFLQNKFYNWLTFHLITRFSPPIRSINLLGSSGCILAPMVFCIKIKTIFC